MGRIGDTLALAAIGAALAAPPALAADAPVQGGPTIGAPLQPAAPAGLAGVRQGSAIEAPAAEAPKTGEGNGGTPVGAGRNEGDSPSTEPTEPTSPSATLTPPPSSSFSIPSIPSSSCAVNGVPPILVPMYQRAAAAYELGPQGPSVLAGINEIETAFGTNLNVSSAGAIGWMQFMPETWEGYGVDANGDGVKDPYNPEDAIFAAASYLSAAGMPGDTYSAIYAYNHADWYVADVLSNAACYAPAVGGSSAVALTPQLQVLSCEPAPAWHKEVPPEYLAAFEEAAARYNLGHRGVWALAAIARLESDFGEGMSKEQLRTLGPLGLDAEEWRAYTVDGDGDGHIRHASPADSAATLARMIWSRGGLRAGVFSHNQAEWYVQAVLAESEKLEGECTVKTIAWPVALPATTPTSINWDNLTLSNDLELRDIKTGALDPRIVQLLATITADHQLTISALRSDHSELTSEGNVSNHFFGRAMDIAAVDGVPCTDVAPDAPCARLGYALAQLPAPLHPTELIYCFDLDGPGPAFARADHCDHVHAGFDG